MGSMYGTYIGEGPIKNQFEGFSGNKEQCLEFIPDPPTVGEVLVFMLYD